MSTVRTLVRAAAYPALVLGAAAVMPADAANFAFEASLSAAHSDNIRLTSTNKEDEDIVSAGLRFSVDQQSARLQADAVGDFSYAEYLNNTYDSELYGNFEGNARFAFVPERFAWVLQDTFGQVLQDAFATPSPGNRENVNYFSTGPDVTIPFSSRARLRLGARYSLSTYEESDDLNFDVLSGEASLIRQLSAASDVSLNVRSSQIRYDEAALDSDYDQSEAFVGYNVKGARTQIGVEAGYTLLSPQTAGPEGEDQDGLLLRLNATRRLTASTTANLSAGREFSNSGMSFASSDGIGAGQRAVPGRQTSQPFVGDSARLGWRFARSRSSLGFSANWAKQSYENDSSFDQTLTGIGANASRELSPRTSLNFDANYTESDFQQADADYADLTGRLGLAWRLSERLSLSTSYEYFRRSGDLGGSDATENRFRLSINYGRGALRSALAGPQFSVDSGT